MKSNANGQNSMPQEPKGQQTPQTPEPTEKELSPEEKRKKWLSDLYDLCEMLGMVTVVVMVVFAFVGRLNIVDGRSMNQTLYDGEYLLVSPVAYTPTPGDIVVIHDVTAAPYDEPIVKRVIAVANQTVDIDFTTWTLTVDGKVVEEPYRYLDPERFLGSAVSLPLTVPEGEIFVLGDNRNNSADSRRVEIGTIDERCVVGRAILRVFPLNRFTVFRNPYES